MSFDLRNFGDKPTTISILILDASNSMKRFGRAPEQAVNGHLDTLRRDQSTEHATCLVTFSGDYRLEIPLTAIGELPPYSGYSTSRGTLLWRTGKRILQQMVESWDEMTLEQREKLRVVVAVMSDGEDTRSPRTVYPEALQGYASAGRRRGWKLLAIGIGVDGQKLANEMGFDPDLAYTFKPTAEGIIEGTEIYSEHTSPRNQRR